MSTESKDQRIDIATFGSSDIAAAVFYFCNKAATAMQQLLAYFEDHDKDITEELRELSTKIMTLKITLESSRSAVDERGENYLVVCKTPRFIEIVERTIKEVYELFSKMGVQNSPESLGDLLNKIQENKRLARGEQGSNAERDVDLVLYYSQNLNLIAASIRAEFLECMQNINWAGDNDEAVAVGVARAAALLKRCIN